MEERGWIDSFWGISDRGKRAKFYRLTTAGRRALKAEQQSWDRYVSAVAGVIRARPAEAT
jgi:DNA-binding PadR family transcriptional regulator